MALEFYAICRMRSSVTTGRELAIFPALEAFPLFFGETGRWTWSARASTPSWSAAHAEAA
jgi:hypothetical protein